MVTRRNQILSVLPVGTTGFFFLLIVITLLEGCSADIYANQRRPTTVQERRESFEQRKAMHENGLFKNMDFRCVGPVVMSGRVVDIEPSPVNPYIFYVAYASGGLWKTENNGMRFEPLFEGQNAVAIGDFAVDRHNPDIIWVGTGEANAARSHYSGTGIYKTTDGGENWKCIGLEDTHHIGRVNIHPENSDIVFAAALGHLYTDNKERGLYRTKDGGENWEKVLYINERTGVIDVTFDPANPDILYAATWEKKRYAWNIEESGTGSGIYKSTDGGNSWTLLEGFPRGEHIGRIGLAVAPGNPRVVYALLDNQTPKPQDDQYGDEPISKRKLPTMTKEEILALDDDELSDFFKQAGFHSDYEVKDIRRQLKKDELTVGDLVDYVAKLDPEVYIPAIHGAEVYRSNDAGETWKKMNLTYLDSMYNIAGYYFGEIRVSPADEDRIYIMGVPLLTSDDGGRTYKSIGGKGVHVDHHAMWIDPEHPDHIINGNDGGLNLSYDGGETWQKLNHVPVGQFYAINVDMAEPYNIYGGLQDNGTYKGSSRSKPNESAVWEHISGGDGFYIQIAEDFTVYSGSQFGHYSRIDTNGKRTSTKPDSPLMDEPGLRFNWQTPILLSSHSDNVFYYGANRLFRSLDRGENLKPISGVLTSPEESGNVPFGTITTIAESKQTFGVLYVGTDDGRVHMTPDGGFNWKEIDHELPQNFWCSRLETSHHTDGLVYISFTDYRNDNFRTYLYRSKDFGETWESIKGDLPDESVNVIREDPINPHVLYVGTDIGVFVSINDGATWQVLQNDIPISPAHDLVIHPRDRDLVVGTHGRSIYVMNIEPIQKLTPKVMGKDIHLFEPAPVRQKKGANRKPTSVIPKPDEATVDIYYWLGEEGEVELTVKDCNDVVVRQLEDEGQRGINVLKWDMVVDRGPVLNKQLEEAQKEIDKAQKKLDEARKKYEKAQEESDVTEEKSLDDESREESDEQTELEKTEEKLRKLNRALEKTRKKVADIQEIIDEADKFPDMPEEIRNKMTRTIYVSKGEYTLQIKSGDHSDSQKLKVDDSTKDRSDKLDTKKKREEETKKLLKEYENIKK